MQKKLLESHFNFVWAEDDTVDDMFEMKSNTAFCIQDCTQYGGGWAVAYYGVEDDEPYSEYISTHANAADAMHKVLAVAPTFIPA
jgi:TnpA family transposase